MGNELFQGCLSSALDLNGLNAGTDCHDRCKRRLAHDTRSDNGSHLGIRFRQVLVSHARNCAGTVSGKDIGGHICHRCAGILIVQRQHQNGTGQTLFLVGTVGTVPLHACHIEHTAQIRRHRHKASVRSVYRHFRERRGRRKHDHTSVGIAVCAAHAIVAHLHQLEHFFHRINTACHILDTGCNHILFVQIQKINFWIAHLKYLLRNAGARLCVPERFHANKIKKEFRCLIHLNSFVRVLSYHNRARKNCKNRN